MRVLVLVVALALLGVGPAALPAVAAPSVTPTAAAPAARVSSTVLDPRSVVSWDAQRWSREIDALAAAGIDDVVLQASADLVDGRLVTYFSRALPGARQATRPDGTPVDVVHELLTRAAAAGITVWVGLVRDLRPQRFAPGPSVADDLQQDVQLTEEVADALAPSLPAGGTVAGWYLPTEINTNYVADPAHAAVVSYFAALTARLHGSDGGRPVMTAPYFDAEAGASATQWRRLWTDVLTSAPLDVVAQQDGTGDVPGAPRDPSEVDTTLRTWFGAVRDAVLASRGSTQLWAALDLYDTTGASAVIGEVAAHAATLAGTVSGFTSFSFTNQISPWTLGTEAYAVPFDAWNRTGVLPHGTPSAPQTVRLTRRGGSVEVSWQASSPAPGTWLAYYRVYLVPGTQPARYAATVWSPGWSTTSGAGTRSPLCVVVVAYATAGDASPGARACDVAQPARRRHGSHRRASRHVRRARHEVRVHDVALRVPEQRVA